MASPEPRTTRCCRSRRDPHRAVPRRSASGRTPVGRLFGPVMVLWFVVLAVTGVPRDRQATRRSCARCRPPTSSRSSPIIPISRSSRWAPWCCRSPAPRRCTPTWATSAASPIRRAWFCLVFPCLTLNYLGQGALILRRPEGRSTTRSSCSRRAGPRIPLVILATIATVIASQAVISGAYSVSRQAVRLGFLPNLTVRHTSTRESGQIYVPAINWLLFGSVLDPDARLPLVRTGWRRCTGWRSPARS